MPTKKLSHSGFLHTAVPLIIVVLVAIIGVAFMVGSHASPKLQPKKISHSFRGNKQRQDKLNTRPREVAEGSTYDPAFVQQFGVPTYGYHYVQGWQYSSATGVAAKLTIGQPTLDSTIITPGRYGPHSLGQIAIVDQSRRDDVEFGWHVDWYNGDNLPHIFAFNEVNGYESHIGCYNGCGYVQVDPSIAPGDPIMAGVSAKFEIVYNKHKWWLIYNGHKLGYYPESTWNYPDHMSFNRGVAEGAWGEVYSDVSPCTQMGNGLFGADPTAAKISGFHLIGSYDKPNFKPVMASDPSAWGLGAVTKTSFRYGGSGYCLKR